MPTIRNFALDDFGLQVAQRAGLAGAAEGEIRRVEIQDGGARAQKIGQRPIRPRRRPEA